MSPFLGFWEGGGGISGSVIYLEENKNFDYILHISLHIFYELYTNFTTM